MLLKKQYLRFFLLPENSMFMPFSVTVSLYLNDNPDYFQIALESILNQTVPPDEVVLTIDGPIGDDLNTVVQNYEKTISCLKIIRLSKNKGLGIAHKIGVENCSYELVAIMDADDIAVPNRFEKQLICFKNNPGTDIVGGHIAEFIDNIENIVGIRKVPINNPNIKKYLKVRCPFNHVTVMLRKSSVLKSGNYQDWYCDEDYYLWCRMLLTGCMFENISDILVYVRVGKDMYKRRSGWKYFISEAHLQKYMLNNKIVNCFEYSINILVRLIVQMLLPNTIRGFVFRYFFRNNTGGAK